MPASTKGGYDKARADYASKNDNNNRNQSSVQINGRTVTDPKQVATIEKNRAASAMYAAKTYKEQGIPIPTHLKAEVNKQAAAKVAAAAAAPMPAAPQPKPLLGGFTGLKDMIDGGGKNDSGPIFIGGLGAVANRLGIRPMGSGGGGGGDTAPARMAPSPGPNYYAPLGAPGKARESNNPLQSGEAAPLMAAPFMVLFVLTSPDSALFTTTLVSRSSISDFA